MLMNESEVHMTAGDVLVQQGTDRAWVNNSGMPSRIAFIPHRRQGAIAVGPALDEFKP